MFKKLRKKVKNTVNGAIIKGQSILTCKRGEGYVDTGVKILIAVVLGALILTLLYALLKTTVMGTVTTKVTELFNYSGGTT